jgi:hypothetical protein
VQNHHALWKRQNRGDNRRNLGDKATVLAPAYPSVVASMNLQPLLKGAGLIAKEGATTYPSVLRLVTKKTIKLASGLPTSSKPGTAIATPEAEQKKTRGGYIKWHEHQDLIHIALRQLEIAGNRIEDITSVVKKLKFDYSPLYDRLCHGTLKGWWQNGGVDLRANNTFNAGDRGSSYVPEDLRTHIRGFLDAMTRTKASVDATSLQPVVKGYIEAIDGGAWKSCLKSKDNPKGFDVSTSFIRRELVALGKSYKKITNNAGKLPKDWEDQLLRFCVRLAYLIRVYKVPPCLLLNLDETPLKLNPSRGKTWSDTGASNTHGQNELNKQQYTLTPVITYDGYLVHLQMCWEGQSAASMPSDHFRQQHAELFEGFSFTYSGNHWVTQKTIKELLTHLEAWRVSCVERFDLPPDSKLILMWDVYQEHRDRYLLDTWIPEHLPHFLMIFVPANLTEMGQPLDLGLNFEFKDGVANRRNEWIASLAREWIIQKGAEQAHLFEAPTSLPLLREKLALLTGEELQKWRDESKRAHITKVCWAEMFSKVWRSDFQEEALRLVAEDTSGIYFTTVEGGGRVDAENARKVARGAGASASASASGGGGGGENPAPLQKPKNSVDLEIKDFEWEDKTYAFAKVFFWYPRIGRFELKLYSKLGAKRCTTTASITGEQMKTHFPDLILKKSSSASASKKRKGGGKEGGPPPKKAKAGTGKKRKAAGGSPPAAPAAITAAEFEAKKKALFRKSASAGLGLPAGGPKEPQPGGVACLARLDAEDDGAFKEPGSSHFGE